MLSLMRRLTIRSRFIATTALLGAMSLALIGGTQFVRQRVLDRAEQAVDQQLADLDAPLAGAREVAFFPPMTGG